jgi:tRNA acetyltransferase TAN1
VKDFNLLLTTYRGGERRAASEAARLLRNMRTGDEDARIEVETTGFPGLLLAMSTVDPFRLVGYMRNVAEEEPWRIRYILRAIPVEKMTDASTSSIVLAARSLASKIGANDTYRVSVEKRGSALSRRELIAGIAAVIDRKVKLEEPDWIVLVEIVEDRAGISVLREEDVFSSIRAKRDRPAET